jgi:hypothetical protein
LIGKKRRCLLCDVLVEIVDIFPEGEDFRQVLSCGHIPKFIPKTNEERIKILENLNPATSMKDKKRSS